MHKSIPVPTQQRGRRGSLFKERLLLISPEIAFIGDSILAKFAEEGIATWDKFYSPLNSGNMGTVGDSTQNLIEKMERDMLPLEETKIVVLMIGATDLRHKLKVSVVFEQIRKIIMLLQAGCRSGVKILVLSVLPRGDANADCNDAIAETNEMLTSLENGFTVRFVSLQNKFYDKDNGKIKEELFHKDRINLSPRGYEVLAETIGPVLKECLEMEITPIALGIMLEPPTLVLTYDEVSREDLSRKKQRRQRRMPIRNFTDKSNVKSVHAVLKHRHEPYLGGVASVTVYRMLRVIQEIMMGKDTKEAVEKVDSQFDLDPEEDLNKVSMKELEEKKEIMDEVFLQNVIKRGDKDFVWDKVQDFQGMKKRSDWDDDENGGGNGSEDVLCEAVTTVDGVGVGVDIVEHQHQNVGDANVTRIEDESVHENEASASSHILRDQEDASLNENLLLSICDGELGNDELICDGEIGIDELISICDFDISLPFGDGDTMNQIENKVQHSPSSRRRLYVWDSDATTAPEVIKHVPDTIIDIGPSFLERDASFQEDEDELDHKTDDSIKYIVLKQDVQQDAELNESDGACNQIVESLGEEYSTKKQIKDENVMGQVVKPNSVVDSSLAEMKKTPLVEDDDDFWGI